LSPLRIFLKTHIGGGKRLVVPYYSPERKAALLKMLLPPLSLTMAEVSRREGVSDMSLSNWRKKVSSQGNFVPEDKPLSENWSAEARFAVVLETASLSQLELGEYCRRKGLYPEQVQCVAPSLHHRSADRSGSAKG
jgi:transposase-like protein